MIFCKTSKKDDEDHSWSGFHGNMWWSSDGCPKTRMRHPPIGQGDNLLMFDWQREDEDDDDHSWSSFHGYHPRLHGLARIIMVINGWRCWLLRWRRWSFLTVRMKMKLTTNSWSSFHAYHPRLHGLARIFSIALHSKIHDPTTVLGAIQ